MKALGMKSNNPYHTTAHGYDKHLQRPIIARIRRDEARVVSATLARYRAVGRRVLEVGPGTGCYTTLLARMFEEVVAVEASEQMAALLRTRLASGQINNVHVHQGDFRSLEIGASYDVAVAIGVLDYIADPAAFVDRMCRLAHTAVVVTAPQRGLLGACFVAGGLAQKTRIYCYDDGEVAAWAPTWRCQVVPAGRALPIGRGLTLVAAFERD